MTKKIRMIFASIIISSMLTACNSIFLSDNKEEEIQLLRDQINELATQNAVLSNRIEDATPEMKQSQYIAEPDSENLLNQIPDLTPTKESLPNYPVKAGDLIVYDNWSLVISKEIDVGKQGLDIWGITIYVSNLHPEKRVFRYVYSGITANDDLGNVYKPYRCEDLYHKTNNLEIESEESIRIRGIIGGFENCGGSFGLHAFNGPIPVNANEIYIHIQDFGPFKGVDVVIAL